MKITIRPTVAVVDDDPDDRFLLERAFEECRPDLRIIFFEGGDPLLDSLRRGAGGDAEAPDLVITDLHFGEKTGFELIEELRADPGLRHIPIVVLTGSPVENEVERCYRLGANTVIAKPDFFNDLVETLRGLSDYWFGPIKM